MDKERDPESNIDDFGARFYSSTYGRWMSPDWSAAPEPVPYANLSNPQTLNLYALVQDNPETFADLDGHDPVTGANQDNNDTNSLDACSGSRNENCADIKPGVANPNQAADIQQGAEQRAQADQQAQIPLQAAQNPDSQHLGERIVQGIEGALNLAIASAKFWGAGSLAENAPDSYGLTAPAAALVGISTAGNIAAGTTQIMGAVTGDTQKASAAAKAVTSASTPTGFTALMATHGNVNKAARWAAAQGVITSSPQDLLKGSLLRGAVETIDFFHNVWTAVGP
jgi:RHS repeat-associated protein